MSYPPPPLEYPGTVDASGVVITDVPCRKCSYNLRGLRLDGRCPECGRAVGLSVQGDLLRFSDPKWLRTLQRGARLIIWGVLVVVLGAILAGVLAAATGAGIYIMALPLIGQILILVGTWRITEPDPSGIGEDQYGTSRKLIRITLVLSVAEQVVEIVQEAIAIPPVVAVTLLALAVVFAIAGVVSIFAQLQYLKKLAMRIPEFNLARRANFLMYALGIGYGVLALAGISMAIIIRLNAGVAGTPPAVFGTLGCFAGVIGLAVLVFAIMFLLLVERLGKRFGEEANVAEQTWARLDPSAAPAGAA